MKFPYRLILVEAHRDTHTPYTSFGGPSNDISRDQPSFGGLANRISSDRARFWMPHQIKIP